MSNENLDLNIKFKDCKEFSAISRLYNNNREDSIVLSELLSTNPELMSFTQTNKDLYTKVFMIMCSNAFEKRITAIFPLILSGEINNIKSEKIDSDLEVKESMSSFLKRNSFNDKFHTLFEWKQKNNKQNNINKMLSMFGDDLKKQIRDEIQKSDKLIEGEKRFIIIGRHRNLLVHKGIYDESLPTNMDLDYIYESYNLALEFMAFVFDMINKIINGGRGG